MNSDTTRPDQDSADALAERVYTLDEPWRSRFIAAITSQVRAGVSSRRLISGSSPLECPPHEPSQSDFARWLRDRSLSSQVRTMLGAWTREGW